VGDPSLEAKLFSVVTGEDMDEEGFLRLGERCANLCRAIRLREGRRGRVDDVLEEFNFTRPLTEPEPHYAIFNPESQMPGKDGIIFSCAGATVRRDFFEQMMDDYYRARGWHLESGLFTAERLLRLNLADLMPELETRGLVKEVG
jgi:aldehyde:ferredoxin oxidoreductase